MSIIHDGYARLQGMANRFGQAFENCDFEARICLGLSSFMLVVTYDDPPLALWVSGFMTSHSFAILSNEMVEICKAVDNNIPRVVQSARQMWTRWFG